MQEACSPPGGPRLHGRGLRPTAVGSGGGRRRVAIAGTGSPRGSNPRSRSFHEPSGLRVPVHASRSHASRFLKRTIPAIHRRLVETTSAPQRASAVARRRPRSAPGRKKIAETLVSHPRPAERRPVELSFHAEQPAPLPIALANRHAQSDHPPHPLRRFAMGAQKHKTHAEAEPWSRSAPSSTRARFPPPWSLSPTPRGSPTDSSIAPNPIPRRPVFAARACRGDFGEH